MKTVKNIIILLCVPFVLSGQQKCIFEHYSTEDGLSHGSIVNILRDSKGFMWFSTWDGLNRFDGYKFEIYKSHPGDNLHLSSNRIERIEEDINGCIWLKTYDNKVFRLNTHTDAFDDILMDTLGITKDFFISKLGDIWIYTINKGVIRIKINDDNSFKRIFYNSDNNKLSGDKIEFVFEDSKNNIWINSEKGIMQLLYNEDSDNFYINNDKYLDKLKPYHVIRYHKRRNDIVFGTSDRKLILLNTIKKYVQIKDIQNNIVSCVYISRKNKVYVGTANNGLLEYDPISDKFFNVKNNSYLKSVDKIYEDSRGLLWMETNVRGTVKYDPVNKHHKLFVQEVDVKPVRHIISGCNFYQDKNNVLWITLKGGGLGYYNPKNDRLEYFYNKPGAANTKMSNFVPAFYIDPSNVIWLSTYSKGIEKITLLDEKFQHYQPSKNKNNGLTNEFRALFEDSYGYLWAGSKDGEIYLLDENYHVVFNITQGCKLNRILVYSIEEDKNKNIWLGTKGDGLFRLKRTGKLHFEVKQFLNDPDNIYSLSGNDIYSVIEDSKSRIWVGTYGNGLNLISDDNGDIVFLNNSNTFKKYPKGRGNRIRQIKEDAKGNIWLATTDGLIFFKPDSQFYTSLDFKRFIKIPNDKNSLGNNDIYCIHNDKEGNLWFGSLGGGLIRLTDYPSDNHPPQFKSYTRNEGLASDVILSIESDDNNNIWMSSEKGIIYFDIAKMLFRKFYETDGLNKTSFSEAASSTRKNGEICFGAFDGIYALSPEDFKNETRKVNLELTSFQLFNKKIEPGENSVLKKSISYTNKITLKHNQNFFSIEYAGLDFRISNNIDYTYILEGYDNHWHKVGNMRIASYTKVPPGKYKFLIKFENPELQVYNPRELEIVILPPPWKTGWAYLLYILISIILFEISRRIFISFLRLRNKVVIERALTNAKLKFFTNISHELRTPLTLILGPVQELLRTEKSSAKGKEYLHLIELNTRRMLRQINQLLEFRKIQNQQLKLKLTYININILIKEVCANFVELAKEKNINFKVNTADKELLLWVDEEKIDTVLYNLLSNAFKFTSKEKSINVNVNELDNALVSISVTDEGAGIPDDKKPYIFKRFASISENKDIKLTGTGIGLSLSKELIDLHSGNIYFESVEGGGSKFVFELKSGRDHFNSANATFIENEKVNTDNIDVIETVAETEISETTNEEVDVTTDKETILVVEDNSDLRKFIKEQLSLLYIVEEAEDGKEGLQKTLELNPVLIISDVMMPVMDGFELLSKIKDNFQTSHIPVILLTAKTSIESKIEGLKYGADAYISKPFNSLFLKEQVKSLLKQRKLLAAKYTNEIKLIDFSDDQMVVTDKDGDFLKNLIEILQENITNPNFKVEVLSSKLGMGRTNFFNKVKGLTGLSPIDFINEYRLNMAVNLLKSGNYNVSEVSYMVGFNDPGYFSKCFKEKYNVAPSKYFNKD